MTTVMRSPEEIVEFALKLIVTKTGRPLSYIQKVILRESLFEIKATYAQIAQENNYSENYIKFLVAPKLWQILSDILGEKVNKTNCRILLEQQLEKSRLLAHAHPIEEPTGIYYPNLLIKYDKNDCTIESPEGQVPLDSPFYIERSPIEQICYQEICHPHAFIRIKGARGTGKTSLIARILHYGSQKNYSIVRLSLHQAGTEILTSIDRFSRWFCTNVTRQLGLESKLDDYWDEDMGALVNSTIYFEDYLLKAISNPVILALDEVNQLFEFPSLARDFLALLRSWYEETKDIAVWQKLRFVLAHATDLYISLPLNRLPFNMGLAIELSPFNQEQVKDLAQRHRLQLNDVELEQLMTLTGGFPYLIRLALYHTIHSAIPLQTLLNNATTDTGIFSQHLQYQLWSLQQNPKLIEAFQKVMSAPTRLDIELAFKLKSLGLVHLVDNQATVSCQLYQIYFSNCFI